METKAGILEQKKTLKVLISGGGTGGHVFPAIAIADAIRNKVPDAEIQFVGAKGKIEMEKVPKAGYPIEGLWISGFHRKLTLKNLLFPLKLMVSMVRAFAIVRGFKPHVAIGVGGFASGPVLRAATSMGVPSLIQEQNSYAGVTNRMLAAKVNKICVAYPGMERYFPAGKIVLTGNPVRQDLNGANIDKSAALQYFGMESGKPVLFVFGGSLGALRINEAMAANAALFEKHPDVQVLWQIGSLYFDRFRESATAQLPHVEARAFIDRMDLAYAMSDLVVCRAGALTIAELCLLGKPAILIPSPNVAEDHQTKNARALVDQDAAVMLTDAQASALLAKTAFELLSDPEKLKELSEKARLLAHPAASEAIAQEVLKLAGK